MVMVLNVSSTIVKKSAFRIKEFTFILFGLGLLSALLLNSSICEKPITFANSTILFLKMARTKLEVVVLSMKWAR